MENLEQNLKTVASVTPATSPAGPDFFKEINRILTATIAGFVGGGLLMLCMYYTAIAFGVTNLKYVLITYFAFYFAILITQILHLYFFKLLDRSAYNEIGNKVFKFALMDILIVLFAFPFLFFIKSDLGSAYPLFLGGVFVFSYLIGTVIREEDRQGRLLPHMLGFFVSMLLVAFIGNNIAAASEVSLLYQTVLIGMVIPVSMVISSLFELVSDLLVRILKAE